jgi:tetratricopeptide (TPR) repeat protein
VIALGLLFAGPMLPAGAEEDVTKYVIGIEGIGANGARFMSTAIPVGEDQLITPCGSIGGATSLTAEGPNSHRPLVLTAVAPPDDLCKLSGRVAMSFPVPLSPRSATTVGTEVLFIAAESREQATRSVIKDKRDAGNRRVIYFETSAPLTAPSARAAFDPSGRFIGFLSKVRGNEKTFAVLQVEDVSQIRWQKVIPTATKSRPAARSLIVPQELQEQFGATVTFVDLSYAYGRTRDSDKALALSERWRVVDPENPRPYILGAFALNRLKFADRSAQDLDKALAISPQYLQALSTKVSVLDRNGRKTEAEIIANKALQVPPTDSLDESDRVNLLLYLKRTDEAVELARRLIAAEPLANYNKYEVCRVESAARHQDAAIAACKEYVTLVPDSVNGWGHLSFTYFNSNRFDDALEAAKKVIEINPEVPEGWNMIGIISEAKGDLPRAAEAESRLQELDPSSLDRFKVVRADQACFREARNSNWTTAASKCSDAAKLDSQNSAIYAALGSALLRDKRIDEGITAQETAVRLNAKNKIAWADLAMAYAMKRDSARTRDAFTHLKQLDSDAADKLYPKIRNVLD